MDAENNVVFEPPVYLQRYVAVQQVLLDRKWKKQLRKVVDFGCAEFKFVQYLKQVPDVVHILDVDIDKQLLEEKWTRVCPLNVDHLNRRCLPLQIDILVGSISDPDPLLEGVDAVIGIEIIEHLFPDTLDALPYNIFSYIRPKLAIFTTPNADFNVLFKNFSGIRHADHKFEWSREQFEDWCHNIVSRYPNYTVLFTQVGDAPEDKKHLGGCSQMAVFELQPDVDADSKTSQNNTSHGVCTYETRSSHLKFNHETGRYYELLRSVDYPVDTDNRTPEQKALDEMKYQISKFVHYHGRYYDEDKNVVRLPVREIISSDADVNVTEDEASELLRQAGFVLDDCLLDNNEKEICVIYDLNMEECPASTSDASATNSEYTVDLENEDSASWNWDLTTSTQNDDWLSQNEYTIAKYPYKINELEFYYAQRIKELEKELAYNCNQTVSKIASNKELNNDVNCNQSNENETRSDASGLRNTINLSQPSCSQALSFTFESTNSLVVKQIPVSEVSNDVVEVWNDGLEVERFSREVLFDSDSQAGLLSALFVSEQESDLETITNGSLQVSAESTSQAFESETESVGTEDNNVHDEPHFYCQGDGLGIHPSVADMGFEDDTTSDESAGSGVYEDNNDEDDGVEENVDEEETLSELEFYTLPEEGSGYDGNSSAEELGSFSTGRTCDTAVGSGIIVAKENQMTVTQFVDLANSSTQDEDGSQFFDTFENATNTSETQVSIFGEETRR